MIITLAWSLGAGLFMYGYVVEGMMTEERGQNGGRTRMDGSRSAEGDSRRVYEKSIIY